MTRLFNLISITILVIVLFASCENDSVTQNYPPVKISENSSEKIYTAEIGYIGGEIKTDNGIKLNIPEGALSSSEDISIKIRKNSPSMVELEYSMIELEPSGLTFSKPLILSAEYFVPSGYNETNLIMYINNNGNWEELVIDNDISNHIVSAEVKHFSEVIIAFNDDLHLVADIPGKYLKKSD